ncbi:MAG: endonuclease III [Proteobacteria bacterium]|nr:endonuclease III [Pseudomonadota bacterium]
MTPKKINNIFKRLTDSITEPITALEYNSEFELLIAVILSAQATDVSVNQATPALFQVAPTPKAMLDLGEKKLVGFIKRIGLYKSKSANIIKTCKILVEEHNSAIPDTREELERLPGVGRKTAGVVLNVAFGKPEIPVDTHVFRVSNRLGLVKAKNVDETEKQLLKNVPDWAKPKAHHLLILHGRHVCKARKPMCQDCCLNKLCEFKEKTVI